MSNDKAVIALCEYLNETEEPGAYWPKYLFEDISFSRWAAGELIEAILDHPFVSPEDTIEEFAIKMTLYSACSGGRDSRRIFLIAAKFAYECLELFGEEYTL